MRGADSGGVLAHADGLMSPGVVWRSGAGVSQACSDTVQGIMDKAGLGQPRVHSSTAAETWWFVRLTLRAALPPPNLARAGLRQARGCAPVHRGTTKHLRSQSNPGSSGEVQLKGVLSSAPFLALLLVSQADVRAPVAPPGDGHLQVYAQPKADSPQREREHLQPSQASGMAFSCQKWVDLEES